VKNEDLKEEKQAHKPVKVAKDALWEFIELILKIALAFIAVGFLVFIGFILYLNAVS
jgi:hypothetical protein